MQEILVIRFSSIGDIVLCTPVFRLLKLKFPDAKITFLTKHKFRGILEGNKHIDRILAWDNLKDREELSNISFDAIVDLHSNLRSFIVKLRFWNVPRTSLNKENVNKFLFTLTKWKRFEVSSIVDRYVETLKVWNIVNDNGGLDFEGQASEVGLEEIGKYVAIVLGGTYTTKRIPQNKLEELFAEMQKTKFVLIGGKEELELGNLLVEKYKGRVISKCGQLSINESAAVLKRSEIVIAGDTGMAHIAAALGKPLALIWGNTDRGYGMSPVPKPGVELKHFEVEGLGCRPCSKLGFAACPKQHFKCMEAQKMGEVMQFAEKYL